MACGRAPPRPDDENSGGGHGPARRDVLNALLSCTLFPEAPDHVVVEVHHSNDPRLVLVADNGTEETCTLMDCSDWKVLQRIAYLAQTLAALAQRSGSVPAPRRMIVYFPYVSPISSQRPVVWTDDETTAAADLTFSTQVTGEDEVTVAGPTGLCRGLRPRHALACRLAGVDSEGLRDFHRFATQVSQIVLRSVEHTPERLAEQAAVPGRTPADPRETVEGLRAYAAALLGLCDGLGPSPPADPRGRDAATPAEATRSSICGVHEPRPLPALPRGLDGALATTEGARVVAHPPDWRPAVATAWRTAGA
eukprot:TRINITY_DN1744_c0_g1_i1.p1 TRINITY_DN1744_c0_g1~~TRINITY_DN1744_c0_g1_i1.p1  ORF type:complete len:308 (-),score=27.62 TRINITY_DN1744_c0_g1_i1:230-1153(-)